MPIPSHIGTSMTESPIPIALMAAEVAPHNDLSNGPAQAARTALGNMFGLENFGVNLTYLPPGAISALHHAHSRQDEFVYILAGNPVLRTEQGETILVPGMCAGFRSGSGNAHHLVNLSSEVVVCLEVGDRTEGDVVSYPDNTAQEIRAAFGK